METCICEFFKGHNSCHPQHRSGDAIGEYCLGGFPIEMYEDLLHQRQHTYLKLVWHCVYLRRRDQVHGGGGGINCINRGGLVRVRGC